VQVTSQKVGGRAFELLLTTVSYPTGE